MKRLCLFLSLFALLLSCAKDEGCQPKLDNNSDSVMTDFTVTKEEAIEKAAKHLNLTDTRSSEVVKSCEYFVPYTTQTRSSSSEEVAFYIINYEGGGFAMVAADERATDVYAFSDEGELTSEDFSTNPGLAIYIEDAVANYQQEISTNSLILPPGTRPGFDGEYGDIPFLVKEEYNGAWYHARYTDKIDQHECFVPTMWNQDSPYNYYVDGPYAGCGPVAAAQIMAYHQYPEVYGTRTYEWDEMLSTPYFISISQTGCDDVAWLLKMIGYYADADYDSDGTSTKIDDIVSVFRMLGYSVQGAHEHTHNRVRQSIISYGPVYMRGTDGPGEVLSDGHAWVVDGYKNTYTERIYYYDYAPYDVYMTTNLDSRIYYHCNWGWGGDDNGYFLFGSFNTINGNYNYNFKIAYNITPN